jgi:uncharacterized membrane protein
MYDVLKALHVLAVTMLAAGIGVESVVGPILGGATTLGQVKTLSRVSVAAEKFLIIPAAVLIPVFGYATAGKGDWDLGMTWLAIGQVLFYVAVAIGLGFLARGSFQLEGRVRDLQGDAIPPEIQQNLKNPLFPIFGALNTLLFIAIVVVMVTKPGY